MPTAHAAGAIRRPLAPSTVPLHAVSSVSNVPNVSLDPFETAARRLRGRIARTPCLFAAGLSAELGFNLWLKAETLQATGAFKERGALNKLLTLSDDERRRGVVAMSAGNHAAGLALHAARLGVGCEIVMPETAPRCKVERTRALGATVHLFGPDVATAREHAVRLALEGDRVFVHPYDDHAVIAGQGTVGLEILEDVPTVDAIVAPVGGGGLLAGILGAVKPRAPLVRVIGARHALCHAGNPAGPTVADGIAVPRLGELCREVIDELADDVVPVAEERIVHAMAALHHRVGLVAEGAGATALAAVLESTTFRPGTNVVVVLSGRNADPETLKHALDAH